MELAIRDHGRERSRLLQYLPGIYAEDPFMGGFLRIFEAIWAPLDRQIDQLHAYFEPRLAPPELLPWLGGWLDLVLDENWPEARRRALIGRAADLYARRGTAGALREYLEVYLGVVPEIREDDDGDPFHFTVVLRLDDPDGIDRDRIRRIIDEEKPAHTTYTLRLEKK
jgi:phage tail-like protein